MIMTKKVKESTIDYTVNGMHYGHTLFEDGTIIAFMQVQEHKKPEYSPAWDHIDQCWKLIRNDEVLIETEVFAGFVDDPSAPHGYSCIYKKAMVPVKI
jgi:hypothetical protein